jgi:hypothetical protein
MAWVGKFKLCLRNSGGVQTRLCPWMRKWKKWTPYQNQNLHKIVRERDAKMEAGEREYCEART